MPTLRCPVCDTEAENFKPFGNPPRPNALCPCCGAGERHRLAWLFLCHYTDLFAAPRKRMFHVAPERIFQERLRDHEKLNYLSADIYGRNADLRIDITDVSMANGIIDVVYCRHVLEHIPDDR